MYGKDNDIVLLLCNVTSDNCNPLLLLPFEFC